MRKLMNKKTTDMAEWLANGKAIDKDFRDEGFDEETQRAIEAGELTEEDF